ncbi:hypothetical protein [Aeromonas veronii]|uniref:hypothetical protein n=1 Tax=Aeromonas veronii TaxID=654 RepID=UPI003D1AC078
MNIITVTEVRSMPGRHEVTIKRGTAKPYTHDVTGTEAPAAKAMELAITCGGEYQIFGNAKVLAEIRKGGISGDSAIKANG